MKPILIIYKYNRFKRYIFVDEKYNGAIFKTLQDRPVTRFGYNIFNFIKRKGVVSIIETVKGQVIRITFEESVLF